MIDGLSRLATVAAFPLGGIGTGNVSLGARGELRDWELCNTPNKGGTLPYTFFAIHVAGPDGGDPIARVLESRIAPPYERDEGYPAMRLAGLPRLDDSLMSGRYPVAEVAFSDKKLPVTVALVGFTPLVPLDSDASGLPLAVLRYQVRNPTAASLDVTIAGSLSSPVGMHQEPSTLFPDIPVYEGRPSVEYRDDGDLRGLFFSTDLDPGHLLFGSAALVTPDAGVTRKTQWLTGTWPDGPVSFWREFSEHGRLSDEAQPTLDARVAQHPTRTGSIAITRKLLPGATETFEFVLAWHFPNRPDAWQSFVIPEDDRPVGVLRNFYATLHSDAWAAAAHWQEHRDSLESATFAFRDALHDSSLDPAVVEAVSANIAAARSTTCFRIEDGTFAAWEGSFDHRGSCEGTCTHVWSYAQTVAHLFPDLERSARRNEFLNETDADGAMQFRSNRVLGRPRWNHAPAVDGQLGTVIRLYREWRFSGDEEFLASVWPAARLATDYALEHWDLDDDGLLDAEMSNTYDLTFLGSEPLSNSYLAAALNAGVRMAEHMGDVTTAERWRAAAATVAHEMVSQLFDGRCFVQRVDDVNAEPYQYGDGVLSDQLIGQQLAHVVGLGHVISEREVRTAIRSVFEHNFLPDLSSHQTTQRVFALGDEGGLVLCSWPDGGHPEFPFVYSDEIWTGVEYQVASHLIFEGFVDEGLTVVRAARDRFDGYKRNPWNEVECGNHYARSMSSWALLLALTGAQYDGPAGSLRFDPATATPLRALFTTGTGWGRVESDSRRFSLTMFGGAISLARLTLGERTLATDLELASGESFSTPL